MKTYNPAEIESKWQKIWEENSSIWQAKDFSEKPKFYSLFEFPYPSGEGLHMGHLRGQTAVDVYARKKRLEGYNVLTPIGWDAFGLPTENYAIKNKIQPALATKKNIESIKKQEKMLGYFLDWPREINTTDPKYYKWTQWIFLQLFKHGLAYKAEMPINWCPSCKIGLANEEVIDDNCERCGSATLKKNVNQWLLRITKYADRLIDGLSDIDFPQQVKTQQINWIGKSEGALIKFEIRIPKSETNSKLEALNNKYYLEVFTTRPDTICGATFMVIAPEHKMVSKFKDQISNFREVSDYVNKTKNKTDLERTDLAKIKTGIEIKGIKSINPVNNELIPIFIADYVLLSYGSGAIMAVPAHDERDFEFATKYNLPVKTVVEPDPDVKGAALSNKDQHKVFSGEGVSTNSEIINGLKTSEAKKKITHWLQENNLGKKSVNFKLRDWIFSRQHYWGEPIPVIYCRKCWEGKSEEIKVKSVEGIDYIIEDNIKYAIVAVNEDQLPILLPEVEHYEPTDTGESPLATIADWVNTKCPKCGSNAKRETDTMPNWAGSSWYFLRYIDPSNDGEFAKLDKLKYWLPVDLYEGGMEHTTLHLLYSRFWNEFLNDKSFVPISEPYAKRVPHGMILASDGRKMSKSLGNVVRPDTLVGKYGADATRTYIMFIGPHDQAIAWDENGIQGVWRFLNKVWENMHKEDGKPDEKMNSKIQLLIKDVSSDIENFKMNTAVAKLMEFNNLLQSQKFISKEVKRDFLRLLYPFAPHICEELNEMIDEEHIYKSKWPKFDKTKLHDKTTTIVIQINGKKRAMIECEKGINEDSLLEEIRKIDRISEELKNGLKKIIYIQDKILNIVK